MLNSYIESFLLISSVSGYSFFVIEHIRKNENPEIPENNRKLFNNKNHPLLTVTITRKLLKDYQFGI